MTRLWRRARTRLWRQGRTPRFVPALRTRLEAVDRYGLRLLHAAPERRWGMALFLSTLVVLAIALAFLTAPGGPRAPYQPVAEARDVRRSVFDQDRNILFLSTGNVIHAFDAREFKPRFCAKSGRLESADGRVWDLTGRSLDGGPSLREYPVIVDAGVVYLDPTRTVPAPAGSDRGVQPVCFPARR